MRASAVTCAAVVAAAAPAAAAECPNAAIRVQQGSEWLPECRAFELVSPVAKNGNSITGLQTGAASAGGVIYRSNGAFAGAQSNTLNYYRATRTASGWTSTALNPPTLGRPAINGDYPDNMLAAPDLSRVVFSTPYPLDPRDTGIFNNRNTNSGDVYRREPDGTFTWQSHGDELSDASRQPVFVGAASKDLTRVVMSSSRALAPPVADETVSHLYAREGDAIRLVSVDADGAPVTDLASLRGLSDDGQTIAFTSGGEAYLRLNAFDATAQTRLLTDTPSCAGADFVGSSADGATAILYCISEQPPGGQPSGSIVRYDVASGERTVLIDLGTNGSFSRLAASRSLSHVYFTSNRDLDGNVEDGTNNTYLLRGDRVSFVARGAPINGALMYLGGDGDQIAFVSGADLGFPSNGLDQVYLFSAASGSTVCASCRADGTPSGGEASLSFDGPFLPGGGFFGNVSADGQRVFFTSADALVPEDVNETFDAYEYVDGRPRLLTTGVDPNPAILAGASLDGSEAYVITSDRLVAEDVDNGVYDMYAVRVDGGFERQAPPTECVSDCRGPLRPQATPPLPGSAVFSGPGDEQDPVVPTTAKVFAVQQIGARDRTTWARTGRLALRVRVSHAGRVRAVVRGRLGAKRRSATIASAARSLAEGGTATLTLRLSRGARTELRRRGALRVTVRVTYSGSRGARTTSFVLRAATRKASR